MTAPQHYAAELVRLTHDMGVILWADGGRLRFRSAAPLTLELVETLRTWKAPLLVYLQDTTLEALCLSMPDADAVDLRQERAAILAVDDGLEQDNAERRAGVR